MYYPSYSLYAYKPPAQESNQAANNGDDCYRYARDGPAAETALVDRGVRGVYGRLLCDVAGDGAGVASWKGAAHAVGDAGDAITILGALHTLISREIVSSEALGACLRTTATTALRASGWARGADSTAIWCLSIGTL